VPPLLTVAPFTVLVEELGVRGGERPSSPTRQSLKLVALEGVESTVWLSLPSEFAFTEAISRDATLQFEVPNTVFDDAMTRNGSRSWVRVRVVGKGSSESRREEIPLEMGRFWKRAS